MIIRYTSQINPYGTTNGLIQLPQLTVCIKDGVFTVVDLLLYLARRLNKRR